MSALRRHNRVMTLHLLKLCVGADSIEDLQSWVEERVAERLRRGAPPQSLHVTRMTPKRSDDLLAGGSLYWVIRGQIAVRQALNAIEPFRDADGVGRCRLWLAPALTRVFPRPMRAFQGWRYLAGEDAPPDISGDNYGVAAMPDAMRRALSGLGLL